MEQLLLLTIQSKHSKQFHHRWVLPDAQTWFWYRFWTIRVNGLSENCLFCIVWLLEDQMINLHYKMKANMAAIMNKAYWIWKQKINYNCFRLNHENLSQPFFFKTLTFLRKSNLLQINEKPLIVALLWLLLLLENRWK